MWGYMLRATWVYRHYTHICGTKEQERGAWVRFNEFRLNSVSAHSIVMKLRNWKNNHLSSLRHNSKFLNKSQTEIAHTRTHTASTNTCNFICNLALEFRPIGRYSNACDFFFTIIMRLGSGIYADDLCPLCIVVVESISTADNLSKNGNIFTWIAGTIST